jgi:hypothetical protein
MAVQYLKELMSIYKGTSMKLLKVGIALRQKTRNLI